MQGEQTGRARGTTSASCSPYARSRTVWRRRGGSLRGRRGGGRRRRHSFNRRALGRSSAGVVRVPAGPTGVEDGGGKEEGGRSPKEREDPGGKSALHGQRGFDVLTITYADGDSAVEEDAAACGQANEGTDTERWPLSFREARTNGHFAQTAAAARPERLAKAGGSVGSDNATKTAPLRPVRSACRVRARSAGSQCPWRRSRRGLRGRKQGGSRAR